jgi:hypothetical protein
MSNTESSPNIRGLTIAALVLNGIVAAGFAVVIAFGDGQMTPVDSFGLVASLLGFFSALGSILLATPEPRPVIVQATPLPERRRSDRRVIDLGSPTGIERRSGQDRRIAELALSAILAPRPVLSDYQIRA